MTRSGKITIRLHKRALSEERNTLRGLKRKVDAGEIDMDAVQRHYQSWIAFAEYSGNAPIRAMDKFYKELFRAAPVYKRKKRYLYGTDCNRKRKSKAARKGE